jgi:hypothetical protein
MVIFGNGLPYPILAAKIIFLCHSYTIINTPTVVRGRKYFQQKCYCVAIFGTQWSLKKIVNIYVNVPLTVFSSLPFLWSVLVISSFPFSSFLVNLSNYKINCSFLPTVASKVEPRSTFPILMVYQKKTSDS